MDIVDVNFQSYKIFLIFFTDINISRHNKHKKRKKEKKQKTNYLFICSLGKSWRDIMTIFLVPLFH